MDKKASNEYVAKTANGFVAVALGLALLAMAVFLVTRAPSFTSVVIAGLALVVALSSVSRQQSLLQQREPVLL